MSSDPREKIETLRQYVEDCSDIGETDAERLLEFSDLVGDDFSDRRHENFLRHATILAEELDDGLLTEALEDREAAEAVVDWIFDNIGNEDSNRNFRVTLRVFGKRLSEGPNDECPPSIDWVPTSTSPEYNVNPGHHV